MLLVGATAVVTYPPLLLGGDARDSGERDAGDGQESREVHDDGKQVQRAGESWRLLSLVGELDESWTWLSTVSRSTDLYVGGAPSYGRPNPRLWPELVGTRSRICLSAYPLISCIMTSWTSIYRRRGPTSCARSEFRYSGYLGSRTYHLPLMHSSDERTRTTRRTLEDPILKLCTDAASLRL